MTCKASGKPLAEIVWLKDGTPLGNQPLSAVTGRRAGNTYQSESELTLAPVRRTDNGIYGCQAVNRYGSDKEDVRLNLLCKSHTILDSIYLEYDLEYDWEP